MSFKINRNDSASPLLPNSAVPEAKGSRPPSARHGSIFSKPLFPRAPKNSSTSMAPRDTQPLLSAEQRANPSNGQAPIAGAGSMKPASSLLNRAGKVMSSGAKVVSSGMHQAGKVMSGAYHQAINQGNHRPSHSGYVRLGQDASAHQGMASASTPAMTPQHPLQARHEPPLTENVRPSVNGQGGGPQGMGPTAGQDTPPMPSSRLLTPLGVRNGNVPQPEVHHRPAGGGSENANPNVSQPSQRASVKANLPAFTKIFEGGSMDRPLAPKQLVKAMLDVSKGTGSEQKVRQEVASNPKWGQQMEQRWKALRNSVADARDEGQAQVPSLEHMVARRPMALMNFLASGDEGSFDKLMRPQPPATPPQATPPQKPVAPEVPAQAPPTRPQGRNDMRPHSPRKEQAVQQPHRSESRPVDEHSQLTATLKNLDQQIAASEKKGKEILHRMFNAPSGAESAAATRESYAHKAQHGELIAAREQVLSARARPVLAKLNDVDGKIAALEQRAGELNKVIARWPSGSQQQVAARKEKNALRPEWQKLNAERAGMQAQLEGLRPEFQQARELAKGLKELAEVQGAKDGHYAIGGRYPLHDRQTIETNFERLGESRHLLGKGPQLQAAQQQLRALLQSGKLEGLSPREAGELGKLARLDVGAQFDRLSELKDVVDTTRANLRAMGAGGLYEGIRTTPYEQRVDREDELRSHQDALDNGYL